MPIPKEGFSPQIQEEMRRINIIFASNSAEAMRKSEKMEGNVCIPPIASDLDLLLNRLVHTDEKVPSWSKLNGVRVLDLAAGSIYSRYGSIRFDPHFSRFCALNGAEVTAVDLAPQSIHDSMLFESIQADIVQLVEEERLADILELRDKTFDIIHSSCFVGRDPYPPLIQRLGGKEGLDRFEEELINACVKLLAEGGVMFHDTEPIWEGRLVYRKVNGELTKELEDLVPVT